MRRAWMLAAVVFLAAQAQAQMGKNVGVRAGTPEDKALADIDNQGDPERKLALLEKFLAEFGQDDRAILAYERYIGHYLAEKDYDKVVEYGEKLLALDPDSFDTAVTLFRVAHERGDASRMFTEGERIAGILARYRARPVPPDIDAAGWEQQKEQTLEEAQENVNYVQYATFLAAYQLPDAAARAALLRRHLEIFPGSAYAANAEALVAAAYQQAQDFRAMLEFARRILARDPDNLGMLLLLSDFWSERGEELESAEAYAKKALELLEKAAKPEALTEEQWAQQRSIQQGVAHAALGKVLMYRNRTPQAVESFRTAGPLLKPNVNSYACNQYRLGFALAKLNRLAEARTVLGEAAGLDSPCKPLAQETLAKIGGARPPAKRRP